MNIKCICIAVPGHILTVMPGGLVSSVVLEEHTPSSGLKTETVCSLLVFTYTSTYHHRHLHCHVNSILYTCVVILLKCTRLKLYKKY